jgi:hypothetical protein
MLLVLDLSGGGLLRLLELIIQREGCRVGYNPKSGTIFVLYIINDLKSRRYLLKLKERRTRRSCVPFESFTRIELVGYFTRREYRYF